MECHACPINKLVQAFADADLDRNMGRCQSRKLKEAVSALVEKFQNVCITCVEEVNDNNPSNHGQIFYSLDSGHCQSVSGRSHTSHSDNNEVISRADWITSHAAYDSQYHQDNTTRAYSGESPLDATFSAMKKMARRKATSEKRYENEKEVVLEMSEDWDVDFFDPDAENPHKNPFQDEFSITTLPSSVEAILLREMNNFAALPALHQMQICCLLSGHNLSDFARMQWLPPELKKWMKLPKDTDVISAQTSHAIYSNICKKIPYLTVLSRATKKRSKARVESQKAAVEKFQKESRKMVGYLSSPEQLLKEGKPKVNPHEVVALADDPKKDEKIARKKKIAEKKAKKEYLEKKYRQEKLFELS